MLAAALTHAAASAAYVAAPRGKDPSRLKTAPAMGGAWRELPIDADSGVLAGPFSSTLTLHATAVGAGGQLEFRHDRAQSERFGTSAVQPDRQERAMKRRAFMIGSAAAATRAMLPSMAQANVPKPYSWDMSPPTGNRDAFIRWMVENRGENPKILAARWDRYLFLKANRDFANDRNGRAFLLTPRDEFVLKRDIARAYERDFHDIGFGVTISGPLVVSRMTSTVDVQFGEKVLEIGTGSGYQAAYLANLTDKVWSIEIIKPLAERTRALYDSLIERGYTEFKAIASKNADGYYGWEEAAPFDKIMVTCGIDHIPPPLLQQLRPNGIMVIPVGPPGRHVILKIVKRQNPDGSVQVVRSNVYNKVVPFVAFTKLIDDKIAGTHDSSRSPNPGPSPAPQQPKGFWPFR
jgi:protein-L-isoaspartate(D-aspartate) O-methyltransferase